MREDGPSTYTGVDALFQMEFKVDTKDDLGDEEEHEDGGEGGVNIRCELAAAMGVAEKVTQDGQEGAEGLEGDVPARADDLL